MTDQYSSAPRAIVAVLDAVAAEYRLHRHAPFLTEHDWRTSEFPEDRSLKTWAGIVPDGRLVLAGLPGLAKVSYGALARAVGVSRRDLKPAGPDDLARVDMTPGGVCPIADANDVIVVLDDALPASGALFCGGGRPELTLEVSLPEVLRAVPRALRAPISSAT